VGEVKRGSETVKEYLMVYEHTENNWAAYSPDVPGCVATGKTREEVTRNFEEALEFHFEGLKEDGLPMPKPANDVDKTRITV
jgi:predicted RNase H-like HicB family nuclease